MSVLQAIILAIIEGITEFLPVSSTGHMIIVSSLMGIAQQDFTKLFTIAIQFGAIVSVVVLYWKRFFQTINFYFKLFVAFIPAAVFGKLLSHYIDELLENPVGVALALLIGGIILLFIDKWFKDEMHEPDPHHKKPTYAEAFKIGMFQVIALIPGVSRSAATIIGGLSQKLTRKAAAEFSFFLAVPTMFAATAYKLYEFYKDHHSISSDEIKLLAVGNVVAFLVALLAIRTFIAILSRYGFKFFGVYRIIIGLIILALYMFGIPLHVV
jgi:undecaprenyl-diphosphatase